MSLINLIQEQRKVFPSIVAYLAHPDTRDLVEEAVKNNLATIQKQIIEDFKLMVENELSYVGVLESNEKRRGYDIARHVRYPSQLLN